MTSPSVLANEDMQRQRGALPTVPDTVFERLLMPPRLMLLDLKLDQTNCALSGRLYHHIPEEPRTYQARTFVHDTGPRHC